MRWNIETVVADKAAVKATLRADPGVPDFVVAYLVSALEAMPDVSGRMLVIRSAGLIENGELRTTTEVKWLPIGK